MEQSFYLEIPAIEVTEEQRLLKSSAYREYIKTSGLLETTKTKVKNILNSAKSAYLEQKKKGYEQGYEEGRREAARIISQASIGAAIYIDKIEDNMVATIIMALKNILGSIGDDKVLRRIIYQTLRSHKIKKEITIRVCPSQKRTVESAVEAFQKITQSGPIVEILADSGLKHGRCVVQTEFSSVDVGVDVQLQMIKTLLTEHILRYKKR